MDVDTRIHDWVLKQMHGVQKLLFVRKARRSSWDIIRDLCHTNLGTCPDELGAGSNLLFAGFVRLPNRMTYPLKKA